MILHLLILGYLRLFQMILEEIQKLVYNKILMMMIFYSSNLFIENVEISGSNLGINNQLDPFLKTLAFTINICHLLLVRLIYHSSKNNQNVRLFKLPLLKEVVYHQ